MRQTTLKPTKRGFLRSIGPKHNQHKFYLGDDIAAALKRLGAIQALWIDLERRAKERNLQPAWDTLTLEIAKKIAKGDGGILPVYTFSTGNEPPEKYVARVAALQAAGAPVVADPVIGP